MASRSNKPRYDPRYDDPYISKEAYPDPYAAANADSYEYIEPEFIPEPPASTFESPGSPPRRRSPQRHKSNRASTQPPEAKRHSPARHRRAASPPPPRSSRYSDSPPRSTRDASPPWRSRRAGESPSPPSPINGATPKGYKSKGNKFINSKYLEKPAVKNLKTYGRKGLHTLGDVVEAYAAAQAPPQQRGRSVDRDYPYDGFYPDHHEDRHRHNFYLDSDLKPHRRRHSTSLSPSPPPRRSARHSGRGRPPMNGRMKSYSVTPPPRSRRDVDHDRGRRKGRRRSPSTSPSISPPRRRHRSHGHRDSMPERPSRRRASFSAAREQMKSPHPDAANRWQMAARAALEAGGVTAFRLRKEPGPWAGPKGARVATAALGAAAIDAFIDKDPRRDKEGGMKGMAENAIGGILASKLMGFKSGSTHKGSSRYR